MIAFENPMSIFMMMVKKMRRWTYSLADCFDMIAFAFLYSTFTLLCVPVYLS